MLLRVNSVTPDGAEKTFCVSGTTCYYQAQKKIGEVEWDGMFYSNNYTFPGTFEPTTGVFVFTEQTLKAGTSTIPLPAVYESSVDKGGCYMQGSIIAGSNGIARSFTLEEQDRD